jgi:cellulose synthase/poly-beta-1,6-N-acetylglucosamine synthase-like glycosyltransferase
VSTSQAGLRAEGRQRVLSIVIPVYNEEATIRDVVARVCSVDIGPLAGC